jgi:hypothetical protein
MRMTGIDSVVDIYLFLPESRTVVLVVRVLVEGRVQGVALAILKFRHETDSRARELCRIWDDGIRKIMKILTPVHHGLRFAK